MPPIGEVVGWMFVAGFAATLVITLVALACRLFELRSIDDRYLTVGTNWKKAAFVLTFHDLSSDTTSTNYGTEWNASASFKINKNYSLLFKYASYDADELFTDTKKGWIMFTAKF